MKAANMNKYSCTMSTVGEIHYVTLVADDDQQARDMAIAETKKGRPRDWSVRVLESGVAGPAAVLASGHREA